MTCQLLTMVCFVGTRDRSERQYSGSFQMETTFAQNDIQDHYFPKVEGIVQEGIEVLDDDVKFSFFTKNEKSDFI